MASGVRAARTPARLARGRAVGPGPTRGARAALCLLVLLGVLGPGSLLGPAEAQTPNEVPGGPILVVAAASNPFGRYYAEILRNEGLNAFSVADISQVSAATLAPYDVVVLGEMPLTTDQVTTFSDWVISGGNLIAMRPDKKLAGLLGLVDAVSTLSDAYLLVDTSNAPGAGIVGETMQFHGTADTYLLSEATRVATLYSTATAATPNPAVTLRSVGVAGGTAAAFAYDLARSVVLTRQGNPAWAGQDRDGDSLVRANDMFFGGAQPDWVDLNKIAIPQADEQQRLLANLIQHVNLDRKPLPRFWYFPRGGKAVVVMTGDDHGNGGTAGRFDAYKAASPAGCSVADWQCIRSTSYIYTRTPFTDAQAAAYTADGFEVSIHITNGCGIYTPGSIELVYNEQLTDWRAKFLSIPSPSTERTHCIVWSDWVSQARTQLNQGIRLDTNYYHLPAAWASRIGFFTGSGMPMRFADLDGTMIDDYQATTEMADDNAQSYPVTVDTLLSRAVGPLGYYGAFTVNMHTDEVASAGSDAVVASAQARGVPIVSALQMLRWVDGRNASSFGSLAFGGNTLSFTVNPGAGANGLRAMVPSRATTGPLTRLARNGSPVSFTLETIKGIEYATFPGLAGSYEATYAPDTAPPVISGKSASADQNTATVTWTTDEPSDSRVDYGTDPGSLTLSAQDPTATTSHSVALTGLAAETTHYYRVTSRDPFGNASTSPAPPNPPASFATTGDTQAPTLTARSPAPGASAVPANSNVAATFSEPVQSSTISFELRDPAGALVPAAVTYDAASRTATLNPGSDLALATTYTATLSGATDLAGNAMAPESWSFTTSRACPCSIWSDSTTPGASSSGDGAAIEVGVKFRAEVDGFVSGVRFYKGAGNGGTHLGNLWSDSGDLLGSATFVDETSTGWQQVSLATPVAVTAGTTYVASYHAPTGNYAFDPGYFATSGVTNPPLTALANGVDGPNGVYRYGATSAFPTDTFNASNYWVDVVFNTTTADSLPPSVTARSPAPGAAGVAVSTDVTATFSEPVQASTISFELRDPSNASVPAQVAYDGSTRTVTLNPNADLAFSTTYTATVSGAADLAGNVMTPVSWSFATAAEPRACPCSIWDASATPGTPSSEDGSAVELGVKFRTDVNGFVTAIRFYKGAGNTGSHVGNLWSAAGTLLASATFVDETSTGWQQVSLATPVAVTAGTTYVASYHAPTGNYAFDPGYFATSGAGAPPLSALANGVDGPNGVYRYGAASAFPTDTFNSSNYWVDLVFDTILPDTTPPVISGVAASPAATSATISWTTDEPTDSRVDYGTSPTALTLTATDPAMTTSHSVVLTGLSPGQYYYRVSSADASGNSSTSPPAGQSPLSFTIPTTVTKFPSGTTILSGSLRSGTAANLGADDDVYYEVNSTTPLLGQRVAAWYGRFTGVSNSLSNLRVTYRGKNSRNCTQTVAIWRWTTSSWVGLDSRTVGTTEVEISVLPGGTLADYVSGTTGDGDVRVRIRCNTNSGSFFTSGDLMRIVYDTP